MNDQHVKGKINELKGKAKENIGHAVGDDSMAGGGIIDQVKGKVQKTLGDLKDTIKEKIDHALADDDKRHSA